MLVYLNGIENYAFRELMREAGVRNACLSFSYAKRNKKIDWYEVLSPIYSVMVEPGRVYCTEEFIGEYIDFINEYRDVIDYALDSVDYSDLVCNNVDVTVIPSYTGIDRGFDYVGITNKFLNSPYSKSKMTILKQQGYKLHGIHTNPTRLFDSMNSAKWLAGKYGYTYEFRHNHLREYYGEYKKYRMGIAKRLNLQGYNIDLSEIKYDDWRTVAFINLIAWKQYSDYMETAK